MAAVEDIVEPQENAQAEPMVVDAEEILRRKAEFKPATVDKEDDIKYDLPNRCAFDQHPLNVPGSKPTDEELISVARENAQLLINKIFQLPTQRVGPGEILAEVPQGRVTPIPRAKPVPKPKPPTIWQQFAQRKGIVKRKRSRLVWDEEAKEWRRRYGYKRANDEKEIWMVEAKPNDDPTVDPFEKMVQDKKERIEKQQKREQRNRNAAARANVTATRLPGTIQLSSSTKPLKASLMEALSTAQRSTASLGRFDARLPEEQKSRKLAPKLDKPKRDPVVSSAGAEKSRNLSVLDKVLAGSEGSLNLTKAVNAKVKEVEMKEAQQRRATKVRKKR